MNVNNCCSANSGCRTSATTLHLKMYVHVRVSYPHHRHLGNYDTTPPSHHMGIWREGVGPQCELRANRSNMRRRDPAIKQTRDRRRRLAPREIKTQNIGLHPSLLSDGPPNQKAIQQDGQYKKELHNRKLVTKVSTVHAKKPSAAYPSVIHAS